jgi:hypothetical protein
MCALNELDWTDSTDDRWGRVPYPWEMDMTVCIAATCMGEDGQKIVICTDRKGGNELGSVESLNKDHAVGHGWRLLTAGTISDSLAVVKSFRLTFVNASNITAINIDKTIKDAVGNRLTQLRDEYTLGRFSMSYQDLLDQRSKFPDDVFRAAVQRINTIDLGSELILLGFMADTPELYVIERTGRVRPVGAYATIGDGGLLASSVLMRRDHRQWEPLTATLYKVYEAKRYAEAVASVGGDTMMIIVDHKGEAKLTALSLDDELSRLYKKYGPQLLPMEFDFKGPMYFVSERDRAEENKEANNPSSGAA